MSIESNVLSKLNEARATYTDNTQIASDLAKVITGMSFSYNGTVTQPNFNKDTMRELSVVIKIDINEDDIEVVQSDNVVYAYIRTDKLDKVVRVQEAYAEDYGYTFLNLAEVMKSNLKFIPAYANTKTWRDGDKLYLLKLNRNSGIIGRFNHKKYVFETQEVNYLSATNEEISRILTKEYLEDYFSTHLIYLQSPLNFLTSGDYQAKLDQESTKVMEVVRR